MASTMVTFEHPKGNNLPDDDSEYCAAEFELELSREPDDPNYGADADGNRGMFVSGYFFWEGELPTKCEECGHEFTDDEKVEMEKAFNKAADEYTQGWEPPEPDYYPDNED